MVIKVAINGFGRIGRLLYRAALETGTDINFGVVNDLTQAKMLENLLKRDSTHGKLPFDVELEGDKVINVSFLGDGCAISQASASLLSEEMKGKTIEELSKLSKDDVERLLEGPVNPGREQCATLILKAVKEALS